MEECNGDGMTDWSILGVSFGRSGGPGVGVGERGTEGRGMWGMEGVGDYKEDRENSDKRGRGRRQGRKEDRTETER
jgi:hypothetical protein